MVSMFPCACVRELWLLLRFTLDRLADSSNSKVQKGVWWEGVRECGREGMRGVVWRG